jgi:chromosome segregation ATPase
MMEVITKDKDDLREQVNLLETEKGENIAELFSARKAIVQLEFEIMTIQEEAQHAKDNHGSIVNDLARLEEDRAILQQEVQRLSRELAEVQGELKTAEASARETQGKLSRAEEEKFQLADEKCSAVARRSVLETEVNMNRLKIASLEKNLDHFEEKIRSLEVEKEQITAQEKDALEVVETAKREEEKLKKDLAETKRIISDLKTENSSIAFRAESAEASVAVLKKDIEEANHLSSLAVEQLGKKVLEGKKAMRKLAKELEASNQTNAALKRAAKYLMKRVRDLETQAEKTEQSFVFSCDLSTEELKTSGD